MKIYNTTSGPLVEDNNNYYSFKELSFDALVNQPNLFQFLKQAIESKNAKQKPDLEKTLLAPIQFRKKFGLRA